MSFLWWPLLLSSCAAAVLATRGLIHLFQLESYQFPGYAHTVRRNLKKCILPGCCLAVVALLCAAILSAWGLNWVPVILCTLLTAGAGWTVYCRLKMQREKKRLVVTARVKRLIGTEAVVFLLQGILFLRLFGLFPGADAKVFLLVPIPVLLPVWFALAALCAWPIEKGISEMYFQDAKRMLDSRPDLIKIGITGSYGKTSVKFILGTILQEKFQTLITPSSFNTPMGLTKVIRSSLLPSHQVFVAEMGARHVGDIRELCRLVHPTYGAITSIGPQHLDTFKTIERIRDTKYELMEALPAGGCCFFVEDHGIERALYDRTEKEKWLVSLEPEVGADVWAENMETGPFGSRFLLCTKGDRILCETRLLGRHNIQNILLAAAICLKLGMSLRQISRGITRLQPVEHRLQLIPKPGGVTIIDDAFNSNPHGASAALEVLRNFPGRRIIITPGMVELGEQETVYNRNFGEEMAGSVDICVLVGPKHTSPIREGLISKGFPEENIHTVRSLQEAADVLGRMERSGDTVLFENDLPDNYSED